jgi:hypothetical protein
MLFFPQAQIQFKKLSWLLLAACFVLLYSCPVKKYLLLTFGNGRATETQSLQFQKDVYSHTEKIVYLRRQSARSVITITGQVVRQVLSPEFSFFATIIRDNSREAIGKAILSRNRAIGGAPPLWLGVKRLLI